MLDLARDFRTMNVGLIPALTIPTYPYTTAGGAQVLGLQQPQASQAIAAFNSFGNTPPPASTPANSSSHPAAPGPPVTAPAVTVAPSSVSVEVANGTGSSGQAGAMVSWLTSQGYHAGLVASPRYGYKITEIHYAPDSKTAAEQIAAKVPGGATLVLAPDLTPTPYNLEIITGSSDTASGQGSGASAGAGGPTTTATTVAGSSPTVYTFPGSSGPPPASCE
jgi:hypothetical protein